MTVKFIISTGKIFIDGTFKGLAYSGNGPGLNNSLMQTIHDVGPIPVGDYDAHQVKCPEKGPLVWDLIPRDKTKLPGRDPMSFMLHWDNKFHDYSASDGCIVPVLSGIFYLLAEEFELQVTAE